MVYSSAEQRTLKVSHMSAPIPTSAPPPSSPPIPPSRPPTPPQPKKGWSKWWWLIVLVIAAMGTGTLVNWIMKKHSTTVSQTPSDDYQRQQRNATNEVAELRQQVAELSARLTSLTTSNSSSVTVVAPTNTTPTSTGLGGNGTNVYSTVMASNISGVVFTAGGNVSFNNIITNMPAGMVVMSLAPWPAWVKSNPTNSFSAPGPKIEVGKMTTMMICKGCPLEINLEAGYSLHPDVNDLKKVTMLWGDDRGCLTFDPIRQFRLPSGHVGTIRNLVWITPDSPDEAVEFRFIVVPK